MKEVTTIYSRQKMANNYVLGIFAGFLLLPGIALAIAEIHLGFLMVIIWLTLLTIRKGIQVDYQSKLIHKFTEYIWIKSLIPLDLYSYKGYRTKKVSESITFNTKVQSIQVDREFNSLELLHKSSNAYDKIVIADDNTIRSLAVWIENEWMIPRMVRNTNI